MTAEYIQASGALFEAVQRSHIFSDSKTFPDSLPKIDNLWDVLTREPDRDVSPHSTRIALPYPYVVPGGRFRESYYWDTYFTAEGLVASGRLGSLKDIV